MKQPETRLKSSPPLNQRLAITQTSSTCKSQKVHGERFGPKRYVHITVLVASSPKGAVLYEDAQIMRTLLRQAT